MDSLFIRHFLDAQAASLAAQHSRTLALIHSIDSSYSVCARKEAALSQRIKQTQQSNADTHAAFQSFLLNNISPSLASRTSAFDMQYDALYSPRSWTQHEHKRLADLIRDNEIERRILICGDVELGGLGGMALNLDLSLSVLADSTTPSRKPQSDTDMDMEAKPDNHATYTTVDMATLNPDLIDWNRVSRVLGTRSAGDCKTEWLNTTINPALTFTPLSKNHIKTLLALVQSHHSRNWLQIARDMKLAYKVERPSWFLFSEYLSVSGSSSKIRIGPTFSISPGPILNRDTGPVVDASSIPLSLSLNLTLTGQSNYHTRPSRKRKLRVSDFTGVPSTSTAFESGSNSEMKRTRRASLNKTTATATISTATIAPNVQSQAHTQPQSRPQTDSTIDTQATRLAANKVSALRSSMNKLKSALKLQTAMTTSRLGDYDNDDVEGGSGDEHKGDEVLMVAPCQTTIKALQNLVEVCGGEAGVNNNNNDDDDGEGDGVGPEVEAELDEMMKRPDFIMFQKRFDAVFAWPVFLGLFTAAGTCARAGAEAGAESVIEADDGSGIGNSVGNRRTLRRRNRNTGPKDEDRSQVFGSDDEEKPDETDSEARIVTDEDEYIPED